MADHDHDSDGEDWSRRYPTGGAPPQPFHVLIPANLSPIFSHRLCLRPSKPEDAEGIFAFTSRPEIVEWEYPPNPVQTIEKTKSWLASKTFSEPPLAAGRRYSFVITQRDDPTEQIVGTIGLNQVVPVPNVGYSIHPDFWGKGYATEALTALLEAWRALPREGEAQANGDGGRENRESVMRERVFATCDGKNVASLKVLVKCGFEVYREKVLPDVTCVCLATKQEPDSREINKN